MNVVEIPVDALRVAPWNPNTMTAAMKKKLATVLKRDGVVQPLVVRPIAEEPGCFEVVGGHQRLEVLRDHLGLREVPCVVVELDDARAKQLAVTLNAMHGEMVPTALAQILHDLSAKTPVDELAAVLPFEPDEINDLMKLLQVPEGFAETLAHEVDEAEAKRPDAFVVVLDHEQRAAVEEAVKKAADAIGATKNPKARALEMICRHYIGCAGAEKTGPRETPPGAAQ
jgi:ParB family chromosome partitioning protein